jgi:hypothetical protein
VVLRDQPQRDDRLTTRESSALLASLSSRDKAILGALYEHRYLDREMIQVLFYGPAPRPAQRRLKLLRDAGLVHMWRRLDRPGARTDQASVWLIAKKGARILAQARKHDPRPYISRAADAWVNCWHVDHDLEANGFFVATAAEGRTRVDQGLYHWVGEADCRSTYRAEGSAITPDGFGRYLLREGEVVFLLEWDRGTESAPRLRRKFRAYVDHFERRRDAQFTNTFVVAPSVGREIVLHDLVASLIGGSNSCSFAFTHVELLAEAGVTGPAWLPVDGVRRRAFGELPLRPRSELPVGDSIAQTHWWERRVGGGERS